MAITPTEALGDKLKMRRQRLNQLEAHLDDKLSMRWTGHTNVTIAVPDGYQDLVEEIKELYIEKGWIVWNWYAGGTQQGEMSLVFDVERNQPEAPGMGQVIREELNRG